MQTYYYRSPISHVLHLDPPLPISTRTGKAVSQLVQGPLPPIEPLQPAFPATTSKVTLEDLLVRAPPGFELD
jgi:hypothetical protein